VVGALVAVNAIGAVTVNDGPHFWAAPFEVDGEFGGLGPGPAHDGRARTKRAAPTSTTLAVVATDANLDKAGARRLAVVAHDGMARAILPSHTLHDGDIVFAISTARRPPPGPSTDLLLGHAAALCLARAIARGVYAAASGGRQPSWRERFGA
jgi:D-aminopeptidase